MPLLFAWEQHHGGGCRCVCAIYHRGRGESRTATCLLAAEAGFCSR
ncbi:DUF6372 family protein [Nocardia sp. NPDC050793]